jgi:4-amino-4-deoxy-L-arabinose transferase-like glycosyltransferase
MLDSTSGFRRAAWVVFGCALAIRLAALWAGSGAELVLDEIAYTARAEALLDGEGYIGSYQSWVRHPGWKIMELPQYPGAYQPPGYPTFMAIVMAASGRSLLAVKLAQCLLSAASCVLLFALGTRWFGVRAGHLASWMCALYPNLIAYSHLLWSETLFVFELLLLLWLLFGSADERLPSAGRSALAGLALGAAALTRGTIVYFAPLLVLWLWLLAEGARGLPRAPFEQLRPALVRGAIVLGVAMATVAPWSIRSSLLHDGFVLIDTNGPYNLWRGNAPGALLAHRLEGVPHYSWPFESLPLHPVASLDGRALIESFRRDRPYSEPTDLAIADYASDVAWRAILAQPARAARGAITKLHDMWNPTSFLLRHFELGAYGEVSAPVRAAISALAVLSYVAVLALAVVGVGMAVADRRVWLILALALFFSAISALAFGLTRFRLPLLPLLMLLAALPLTRRSATG